MVVRNYFAIAPTTEEIYQKFGVYTIKVRNYSALAPLTEYLRQRYMDYILWWYIITSPSYRRKRRYSGNKEYILWRCSNFFAISLTNRHYATMTTVREYILVTGGEGSG